MPNSRLRLSRIISTPLLAIGISLAAGVANSGAPKPKPLPPFANVEVAVEQCFATLKDYKAGDLITRDQVAPLFVRLKRLGWAVADRATIVNRVLTENDLLTRQLRGSEAGIAFMREIAKYPLGYDRVDRLNRLPLGRQTVHDMIHKVGGAEMIRYMTTAQGGEELGKMLSRDPGGKDFNKPTGRIYTAEQLIDALKSSYRAEKARRKRS